MSLIPDPQPNEPIALTDVPSLLPKRRGKKVHHSTVYRWTTKGVRGRVLESHKMGNVRFTTVSALNRFFDPCKGQEEDSRRAAIKRALYGNK